MVDGSDSFSGMAKILASSKFRLIASDIKFDIGHTSVTSSEISGNVKLMQIPEGQMYSTFCYFQPLPFLPCNIRKERLNAPNGAQCVLTPKNQTPLKIAYNRLGSSLPGFRKNKNKLAFLFQERISAEYSTYIKMNDGYEVVNSIEVVKGDKLVLFLWWMYSLYP